MSFSVVSLPKFLREEIVCFLLGVLMVMMMFVVRTHTNHETPLFFRLNKNKQRKRKLEGSGEEDVTKKSMSFRRLQTDHSLLIGAKPPPPFALSSSSSSSSKLLSWRCRMMITVMIMMMMIIIVMMMLMMIVMIMIVMMTIVMIMIVMIMMMILHGDNERETLFVIAAILKEDVT